MGIKIPHRQTLEFCKKLGTHPHKGALRSLKHQPLLQPLSKHGNRVNNRQKNQPGRKPGNSCCQIRQIGFGCIIIDKFVDDRAKQIRSNQRRNRIDNRAENRCRNQYFFMGKILYQTNNGYFQIFRFAGNFQSPVTAGISAHIHLTLLSTGFHSAVFRFNTRGTRFIHGPIPPRFYFAGCFYLCLPLYRFVVFCHSRFLDLSDYFRCSL